MLKGLGCFKFSTTGFSIVVQCHGRTLEGQDYHVFLAIEPQNYRAFKRRYLPGQTSSFSTFGFELLRGWGREANPAVVDHLAFKHGIEFGVSEDFLNRMVANIDPVPLPLGREFFINNVNNVAASA